MISRSACVSFGSDATAYIGDGGPAAVAALSYELLVAADARGILYVADIDNHRVRRIDGAGIITTIAGNGEYADGGEGGPATKASFMWIAGIVVDPAGVVYVADSGSHRVRRIDARGIITTVAGDGTEGFTGDGSRATLASLRSGSGG